MIKTPLGNQVRDCLTGVQYLPRRQQVTAAMSLSTKQKLGYKIKRWQSLARKYQQSGLSQQEVTAFLDEIQEKKTQADLILELTVRSSDLKDAGSEVRVFIDRLMEDLAIKDPLTSSQPAPAAPVKVKKTAVTGTSEVAAALEQGAVKTKTSQPPRQLAEILAQTAKLWQQRENLTPKQTAALYERPDLLLNYLQQFLLTTVKNSRPRRRSPFKSLKIRIFGAE